MTRKPHPNTKLTEEDVEHIRQLLDWKKSEMARINSIASCAAIAEKFDVHKRTIENISNYTTHRAKSDDLQYFEAKSEEARKNISLAKLAQDNSAAGEYTRATGIPAIDVIREMAPFSTKTEVSSFFGWKNTTSMMSWLSVRGYEVQFKKAKKPVPPINKNFGAISFGRQQRESVRHAAQNTL